MKKILMRFALFGLLVWSILRLMSAVLPYYWGNPGYAAKVEYLGENRDSFNVFFIGSSRIYRHVMPAVFDTHTQGTTRSFNLGYRAAYNPESYYLLENFIKKKAVQPTKILIELQPFVPIADRNLYTVRSNYFLNYSYFLLVKNEYSASSDALEVSNEAAQHHIKNLRLSFLNNILKTSHSREMLLSLLGQSDRDIRAIGKAKDGFVSLNKSALYTEGLVKRRAKFLTKYDSTKTSFEAEMASYQIALKDTLRYPTPHLQKINQLIEVAARQNYMLTFVLPPKRSELLPLLQQIPTKHRLNIGNPQDFPHFYHNKYWFDKKHFNERGAEIFTQALAKYLMLNESD